MSITVSLPWPNAGLSPNARSRTHHKKARLTKKARADAFWTTKAAGGRMEPGDLFDVTVSFLPPDRRARDRDNLLAMMKPSLDGIAQALGVNDNLFRPRIEVGEPVNGGRVEVTIIPMEAL